jgi:hypothetical protein
MYRNALQWATFLTVAAVQWLDLTWHESRGGMMVFFGRDVNRSVGPFHMLSICDITYVWTNPQSRPRPRQSLHAGSGMNQWSDHLMCPIHPVCGASVCLDPGFGTPVPRQRDVIGVRHFRWQLPKVGAVVAVQVLGCMTTRAACYRTLSEARQLGCGNCLTQPHSCSDSGCMPVPHCRLSE